MGPINYIVKDLRPNPTKLLRNVSVRHLKLFHEEFQSRSEVEILSDSDQQFNNDDMNESFDEFSCNESLAASISYGDGNKNSFKSRKTKAPTFLTSPYVHENNVANANIDDDATFDENIENSLTIINPTIPSSNSSFHSTNSQIAPVTSSSSDEETICEPSVRRSTRTHKPVDRYGDFDYKFTR